MVDALKRIEAKLDWLIEAMSDEGDEEMVDATPLDRPTGSRKVPSTL